MGKTCSQLICQGGCGKIRNNFEDLYSLSLEVQGRKTLKDSLEKYISEERIEDFFCSNCQKKVNVMKRTSLAELPNILIVHLQRIFYDYDTLMNAKINSRLEFPKKLNLKAYCTEVINNVEQEENNNNDNGISKNKIEEENARKQTNDISNNIIENYDEESNKEFKDRVFHKNDDYYEYELVGVVVHLGVANAGHYYSYINIQRDGTDNQMNFNPNDGSHVRKWMTFNDSSVTNFSVDQIESECYGGSANGKDDIEDLIGWNKKNDWDNSKNAYMLVYEKIKKTPITLVITESQLKLKEDNQTENSNYNNTNYGNEDEENQKINLIINSSKTEKNFKEILKSKKLNEQIIFINKTNYFKILKEIQKITSGGKVSLDCDDTAISRRDLTSESIYDFIFYNEDKDEYFYYIPFYKFGKAEKSLLPAAHMREVLLDNLLFSNDQNIFCNEFSEFLDKAICDLYEFYSKDKNKIENENLIKKIIEILLGYALNILSKAYSRDALGKLVNNLIKFLEIFPEFSKHCLESLVNNKELVIEILFSSEENSNLAYKNLVCHSIINYAKFYKDEIQSYQQLKRDNYYQNNNNINNNNKNPEIFEFLNSFKPLIYKLLDTLIDLMPIEVSKNWNHMLAYLELFESLSCSNNELILDYLFEKQLVSRLIDLALGKESPLFRKGETRNEIGNKIAPPKFTPLLNTVSNLVRRSFTETFTKEIYEELGRKNFPNTLILLPDNEEKIYSLSQSDFECLHQRSFYKKCIKDGYNNCALSKLLAHLMFDNFELSKKRVYLIMETVNEGISLQEAKAGCELIFNVSNLNDRYNIIRLEWIFGIPQLQLKLFDTQFPAVIKNNFNNKTKDKFSAGYSNSYNEKIYKFISSILYGTSLDSLIERLIYKYQASTDFITILNYFFSIVFKNAFTFNYIDSLPHPKDEKLKLKDFIFQLAKEEINRIYNVTNSESKFEKAIKGITVFMESYESKKQEFSRVLLEEYKENENKFKFQPAYELGEITKQTIKNRKEEVINKHNMFCFEIEYENIVESFAADAEPCIKDKEQVSKLGAEALQENKKNEETQADTNDIVISTAIDYNNNEKIEEEKKDEFIKEESKQSSNESKKNLDENEKPNSNNSNVAVFGDEQKQNLIKIKAFKVSKFDENTSISNNSQQFTTANKAIEDFTKYNEETFLKRNLEKLITSEDPFISVNRILKQQPNATKVTNQNCIRRIILFNNSENDYKVRFSFYSEGIDDFENFYLPKSDIIVIAKKNSVSNVQTFVKHDCLLPWNEYGYLVDCELYESSNSNSDIRFTSNTNFKRSKSQTDVKGESSAEAPLGIFILKF